MISCRKPRKFISPLIHACQRLPAGVKYAACVIIEKGFSFVTIPLATRFLAPADYGRLDLAVSIVEFFNIIFLFGLSDTLVRFASSSSDEPSRTRCVSELLGTGILLALILGLGAQLAVPANAGALAIEELTTGLRWALAATSLAGVLDLCLMWLRFVGSITHYIVYVTVRSALQFIAVLAMLHLGFGANGMLIANASVLMIVSAVLAGPWIARHGVCFSLRGMVRIGAYGIPLVAGALATFALGSSSRWFMAGTVSLSDIGLLALAGKLAAVTTLLMQPFMLWWKPRRLALLGEGQCRQEAIREWNLGFALLVISALAVCLAGPIFVSLFLPASFSGASRYLPWMVAIVVANELATLSSVASYARPTGLSVMAINCIGASVAIAGFHFLIPDAGITGAIAATLAAQITRLSLFASETIRSGLLPLPAGKATIPLAVTSTVIAVLPDSVPAWPRLGLGAASLLVVAATLALLGFLSFRSREPDAK